MSGYFFISQLTSPHTHLRRPPTTVDRAHRLTDRLTGSTAAAAEGTLSDATTQQKAGHRRAACGLSKNHGSHSQYIRCGLAHETGRPWLMLHAAESACVKVVRGCGRARQQRRTPGHPLEPPLPLQCRSSSGVLAHLRPAAWVAAQVAVAAA